MADVIDELQIEINANANKANDAIDRLVGKLDRLTITLGKVDGTSLRSLANGVERLGSAMQIMNTIKTADFTRLAKNLSNLGNINTQSLNSAATSMRHITSALSTFGSVSGNAQSVSVLAQSIAKLGYKSVSTAITNIPQLAIALNNLMIVLSKAPTVSRNVIDMTNALANLSTQGSKVGSASNSIARGLNTTTTATKRARNGFKGLASYIGKFYATYFMVVRGIKSLWSSIESTADYIEAYNYFNVALGKIGSDWKHEWTKYADEVGVNSAEEYAESFAKRLSESLNSLSGVNVTVGANGKGLLTESGMKNLGLNIQQVTQYASQLASITNSVGQSGEASLAISKNFTRLAGDISSLFNIDYSSAAQKLQSGIIGQSRALYSLGIDITNATLQQYAYNLGIEKAVKDMSQMEKQQLRYIAIMDQSRVSWGDLANTINSPSNMMRQFSNNLKETGMILGQLFIPVLQRVMPVINGVSIAFKRLLVDIAGFLDIKIDFDSFGQGYSELEDELEDESDAFSEATKKAKEYQNQLMGFDEIEKLKDTTGTNGNGGSGGEIDLTPEILAASNEYEKVWKAAYNKMENQATVIADRIDKAFKPLKNIISYIINDDMLEAGTELAEWINKGLTGYDWGKIGTYIGKRITGTFDFIAGFTNTLNWKQLAKDLTNVINNALRNIKPSSIASAINGLINGLWDFTITFIKTLDWGELARTLGGLILNLDWGTIAKIGLTVGALKLAKSMLSTFGTNFISGFKGIFTEMASNSGISSAISAFGAKWGKEFALAMPTSRTVAAVISAPIIAGFSIALNDVKADTQRWEEYHQWLIDKMAPTKEWQEKIDEFDSITEELVERSNERLKSLANIDIDMDFTVLKNMTDRYFELAENQDKSVEEMKEFNSLHQTLIDKYPELSEVLKLESDDYNSQRDAVNELIKSLEEKAKTKAYEELLVQAYKDQAIAQKNVIDTTNSLDKAQEEYNKARDEFLRLDKERVTMEDEIHQKQLKGIDISKEEEEALIRLQTKTKEADEKYSGMARTVLNLRTESKNAQKVYNDLGEEIKSYSSNFANEISESSSTTRSIVSQGNTALRQLVDEANKTAGQMPTIGSNITTGLANGIRNSWQKVAEAAKVVGGIPSDVIAKMNQIHSPSKLFKEYGKFIDDGFAIGIEDNTDRSIKAVRDWGKDLQNMATSSLPSFSYTSAPNYNSNSFNTNVYNNSEEIALLRQQVSILQSLLAKDNVVISADTDGIFKMIQGKSNNYTRQNGTPAFMF